MLWRNVASCASAPAAVEARPGGPLAPQKRASSPIFPLKAREDHDGRPSGGAVGPRVSAWRDTPGWKPQAAGCSRPSEGQILQEGWEVQYAALPSLANTGRCMSDSHCPGVPAARVSAGTDPACLHPPGLRTTQATTETSFGPVQAAPLKLGRSHPRNGKRWHDPSSGPAEVSVAACSRSRSRDTGFLAQLSYSPCCSNGMGLPCPACSPGSGLLRGLR